MNYENPTAHAFFNQRDKISRGGPANPDTGNTLYKIYACKGLIPPEAVRADLEKELSEAVPGSKEFQALRSCLTGFNLKYGGN